MFTMEKQKV